VLCALLVIIVFVLVSSSHRNAGQQFVYLAQSFLHGHTNFQNLPPVLRGDTVLWHGRYYWPLGAFPAVLLMPFVAFFNILGKTFYIQYLQTPLIVVIIWQAYSLARKLRYKSFDSILIGIIYLVGTPVIGISIASGSTYFAHIVVTCLLLWCLNEYWGKKRWWLLGSLTGCLLLTRATSAAVGIFLILELWRNSPKEHRQRLMAWLSLLGPIIAAVTLQLAYNFARFHNLREQGYSIQILSNPGLIQARSYGLFSLLHVPANLYYMLINAPTPVFRDNLSHVLKPPYLVPGHWGLSLFVTSPFLLYLFTLKRRAFDSQSCHLLIAAGASCLAIITYYGIGYSQFGYRYALDFLPLIFVLFLLKYRETHSYLSQGMKLLLLTSSFFNFYLLIAAIATGQLNV
jgi:uncharacterized membrane protein